MGMGVHITVDVSGGVSSGGFYDGVSTSTWHSPYFRHAVTLVVFLRTSLSILTFLLSVKHSLCVIMFSLIPSCLRVRLWVSIMYAFMYTLPLPRPRLVPRESESLIRLGVWCHPHLAFLVVLPCCASCPRFLFLTCNVQSLYMSISCSLTVYLPICSCYRTGSSIVLHLQYISVSHSSVRNVSLGPEWHLFI